MKRTLPRILSVCALGALLACSSAGTTTTGPDAGTSGPIGTPDEGPPANGRPACASTSDPCGLACTTMDLEKGCVVDAVSVPLGELVPRSLWTSGGEADADGATIVFDVTACRVEVISTKSCAEKGVVDIGRRSCTWQQGFSTLGECTTRCDVPCSLQ